ncbi:hypothetical protein [Longitalea luteola]|uniref:hypothetical protein n=1 Tax=Longitalea luteola TaxID=2812563 RepID=UPI001A965662|nr:hypothetical protein [Longitalea luteola]
MENSFLWKQCRLAYRTMQLQLKEGAPAADEVKWIERAFGIAMHTWFNIEKLVTNYHFADQEEENHFYRTLQPQFLGLIDYLTILYKSVLFEPDERMKRCEYWQDEYQHCRKIIARCKAERRYYERAVMQEHTGQPSHEQPVIFGSNINYNNIQTISYSNLAGRMIALKKYMQYLKEKRM